MLNVKNTLVTVCLAIIVILTALTVNLQAFDYEYTDGKDFDAGWDNLVYVFTVNLDDLDAPEDYQFDEIVNCTPSTVVATSYASYVDAYWITEGVELAAADYNPKLDGLLIPPGGGGGGTLPTWMASFTANNFWIDSDGGYPDVTIPYGENMGFISFLNQDPVSSQWKVDETIIGSAEIITIGDDNTLPDGPGVYTITATFSGDEGSGEDSMSLTAVGVSTLVALYESIAETSSTNSPGANETLLVPKGKSVSMATIRTPDSDWPTGFPKWKVDNGNFENSGNDQFTFTPSNNSEYIISAHCGDDYYKSIKIVGFEITDILHQKTGSSELAMGIQNNEIIFSDVNFTYTANTNPSNLNDSNIRWEIWEYDWVNSKLNSGTSLTVTTKINAPYDECDIRFYYDENINGSFDDGGLFGTAEHNKRSNPFNVREIKEKYLSARYTDIVTNPQSAGSLMSYASRLLNEKHTPSDFRAAVNFNLSGTSSQIASSGHDPVRLKQNGSNWSDFQGDQEFLNGYADVVLVDDIALYDEDGDPIPATTKDAAGYGGNSLSKTYQIILDNESSTDKVLAHEIGHNSGLEHYNYANNVMFFDNSGNNTILTRSQAIDYE